MVTRYLKRIIGHREIKETIIDKMVYKEREKSFSGGSLSDSNILIVTNRSISEDAAIRLLRNENAGFNILYLNNLMSCSDITDAATDLIGPFTHIVNVVWYEKTTNIESEIGGSNDDAMFRIYQWHQEEVDYLVKLNQYGTLCTVFIGNEEIDSDVIKKNVELLVKGLAESLANHGLICNGIVANQSVPIEELLCSALFLSSKYGQIMTGEVLHMETR